MILCENLSKTFNSGSGIKNINLQFLPGFIYGIIGYNGAGKTTLLNCIEGLYTATSGFVLHNDIKTTNEKDFVSIRRKIAFLPSDEYLYPMLSCSENIELATILKTGKNKLLNETEALIKYFEVDKYLNKRFRECSTGMKKKVQIVISLIGGIDTIIWDEPNDGLDIVSNIKIKNLLKYYKSKNVTVLFSSHVIEFLDNFIDKFVLLNEGEVIDNNDIKNISSLEELFIKNMLPDDQVTDLFFNK
ncbi:MAG: ABC transporter ATP-binding protein [Treponema sp.]|nr:ABC transporter ATP-binding protein [Treponema sp.]